MIKKHCLFCNEIITIIPEGDYDKYVGCSCSPDGFYSLLRDSYACINSYPYQKKRDLFHLVSAYIRELTDCDEKVTLSVGDLEAIENSPNIPVTIEDKGTRLLQYLYRHSGGPEDPVVIHPLASSYNITYSPNLQELVYIIDTLVTKQLLIREGKTFKLTETGWREAVESAGGKKLKPCLALISDDEKLRTEWQGKLFPKMEQFGYMPRLLPDAKTGKRDRNLLELVSKSKLIIADLTNQSPEVYFAAGYALGLNIPVIWTVNSSDADNLSVQIKDIRPIVWDRAEELAVILQQRLV